MAREVAISAPKTEASQFSTLTPWESRALIIASLTIVLISLSIVLVRTYGDLALAIARGEADWRGAWIYEEAHHVEPHVTASLDLETVHRSLFPEWVVSTTYREGRPEEERESFAVLREAVANDENLTELLDEMRGIVHSGELIEDSRRLGYLSWSWSTYLDRREHPFFIRSGVGVRPRGTDFFYTVVYRVESDVSLEIGGEPQRIRVMSRIDGMNLRDHSLGCVTNADDGAIVFADPLQGFVLDAIWPILDNDRATEPLEALHAEAISEEVEQGIGEEAATILAETSKYRAQQLEAFRAIASRRYCSGFSLRQAPVQGYDEEQLFRLALIAYASERRWCPLVKLEEAETLLAASRALASEPRLRDSLEQLTAWFGRTVAVHEGRHIADARAGRTDETFVEGEEPLVSSEISAYLASFAWGPAPATAFYQACRAIRDRANPHAAAMETIQQGLGHTCLQGPLAEIAPRSRELEETCFHRSEPVELPPDFPMRIALPPPPSAPRIEAVARRED